MDQPFHLILCVPLHQASGSSQTISSREANYNDAPVARVIPYSWQNKACAGIHRYECSQPQSITGRAAERSGQRGTDEVGSLTILQINKFLLMTICGAAIMCQLLCRQLRIEPQTLTSWSLESKCTLQSKS